MIRLEPDCGASAVTLHTKNPPRLLGGFCLAGITGNNGRRPALQRSALLPSCWPRIRSPEFPHPGASPCSSMHCSGFHSSRRNGTCSPAAPPPPSCSAHGARKWDPFPTSCAGHLPASNVLSFPSVSPWLRESTYYTQLFATCKTERITKRVDSK